MHSWCVFWMTIKSIYLSIYLSIYKKVSLLSCLMYCAEEMVLCGSIRAFLLQTQTAVCCCWECISWKKTTPMRLKMLNTSCSWWELQGNKSLWVCTNFRWTVYNKGPTNRQEAGRKLALIILFVQTQYRTDLLACSGSIRCSNYLDKNCSAGFLLLLRSCYLFIRGNLDWMYCDWNYSFMKMQPSVVH